MRDYFNSALGCQLLYKFERAQYADLLATNPGVSVSKLYGPIHLLRFVSIEFTCHFEPSLLLLLWQLLSKRILNPRFPFLNMYNIYF